MGEALYDFSWYPCQHVNDPSTCCFVTTGKDAPIHLIDQHGATTLLVPVL